MCRATKKNSGAGFGGYRRERGETDALPVIRGV